ncbi:putative chorismate mutase domain-containing protein [Candidatus Hepatincolaceae symbiont of Richtersius coronifer]
MDKIKLLKLRKIINQLDKEIINLLRKRSFIIPKVKKIKEHWPYKIAFKREVDMASNLYKKDFGLYDKVYMQRIWREIISATLKIECDLRIAIFQSPSFKNSAEIFPLWEITKDHFGSHSNFSLNKDAKEIFSLIANKKADCGIFQVPSPSNNNSIKAKSSKVCEQPWWSLFLQAEFKDLRINLILPHIQDFKLLVYHNLPSPNPQVSPSNQANYFQGVNAFCVTLNQKDVFSEQLFYILVAEKEVFIELDQITIIDKYYLTKYFYLVCSSYRLENLKKLIPSSIKIIFIGSSNSPIVLEATVEGLGAPNRLKFLLP